MRSETNLPYYLPIELQLNKVNLCQKDQEVVWPRCPLKHFPVYQSLANNYPGITVEQIRLNGRKIAIKIISTNGSLKAYLEAVSKALNT